MPPRKIAIMPEYFVEIPLWDEGTHTDGDDLNLSDEIRIRLSELPRVYDEYVDGDAEGNARLWDRWELDGQAVSRDLQAELGPNFAVRLWVPEFRRKS